MPETPPGPRAAEPFSAPGGPHGALVLHGFTGNPSSMRGVAEALAAAGFAVELPLLPGHGTSVEDMLTTDFSDWSATAEAAYLDLAGRTDSLVVVGLSMGGTLGAWVTTRNPGTAGLVVINGMFEPPAPSFIELLHTTLGQGVDRLPAIGSDIARPDVSEGAYDAAPIAALISLMEATTELHGRLGDIHCPVLILTSPQDHVVPPSSSDVLAEAVAGPVERVTLERSYHVATLDFDRDLVEKRTVEFALRVTTSRHESPGARVASRHPERGGASVAFETIPQRVLGNARRFGAAPAYYVRGPGGWEATSWEGYAADVRRAGAALVALGVEAGQSVCILGANRPEWVTFDVGAMAAGAVPAGIYTTSSPSECAYILNHSEAPVLLVENEDQWQKIASVRAELPHLRHVVMMLPSRGAPPNPRTGPPVDDPMVLAWDDFLTRGDGSGGALEERLEALRPDTVSTLIYTSGTTGRPKAVMLTQDNLTWTAEQACGLVGASAKERVLSYLPLSHIAEQMFTVHIASVIGYPVYYAESLDKLLANLMEVKPTVFFGVPRVWEKFHAGVVEKLAENHGVKAKLAEQATAVGRRVIARLNRGERAAIPDAALFTVFEKLVYSKVREGLGLSAARVCVSGAAPISPEVLEFFAGFGLPIYEVYGQSEDCGPTSFNVPGRTKFGTVGPPFPGVEVKIAADGEILVRGRNVFAGYAKDPEATAEVLSDGWLNSGDLGEFDGEGFLSITGRKKDIIITAGGKNVAPKLMEGGLRNHPLVAEAVVVGDRRKFLTVLVSLDSEAAAKFMADRNLLGSPDQSEEIRAGIQRALDDVNAHMARVEQIKKFTVLPRELSIAEGELTPTLKVKRNVVTAHFEAEIEAMYAE